MPARLEQPVEPVGCSVISDDDGRHQLEGLSCPTDSIATTTVDVQSGSTWATSTEALAALQASVPGMRHDGWELELQAAESMRWVRETDGHVVSIATFRWGGSGWTYGETGVLPVVAGDNW